ncbi:hypothetical protein BofuT4_uP012700.1 [Botrytis cinerea T4]|uniref:Uncharacterized protein n=1 Tax=Botryotinia fuckeliana (strain T4) TaxID=999810 RepID=G2XQZ3_BOTF4|nr:hypothetical protein BofuT4_uP012700.1 [Botrytis cinerea T4]
MAEMADLSKSMCVFPLFTYGVLSPFHFTFQVVQRCVGAFICTDRALSWDL